MLRGTEISRNYALADRPSISVDAYGANTGVVGRHVLSARAVGSSHSGYANRVWPNLWDRSVPTRARLGI